MELVIAVQNMSLGGLRDSAGNPEDRWPLLVERLCCDGLRPDLVLLQEASEWHAFGHRQLGRAMSDLGMEAAPIPPSSSGIPPILLYRRETVGAWKNWNTDFSRETLHGFGVAVFDVGLPAPLAVASVHLNPFVADKARDEAKLLATRAMRYGPYGIVAGDINYPPCSPDSPAPDYSTMRPYNRSARTRLPSESGGELLPERRVTEMLTYSGYVDVAWHLYELSGRTDTSLLARTGTDDRIDQGWVSRPLAPALTDYRLVDAPVEASDHKGFTFTLDLSKAATDHVWEYQ